MKKFSKQKLTINIALQSFIKLQLLHRRFSRSMHLCTRMGDRLRYVANQLGRLSLVSLRGRLIEYQLRLG